MPKKGTTVKDRTDLTLMGFVRVDGLQVQGHMSYIIEPRVFEFGRFDMNNGVAAIVTDGGEVWIATIGATTIAESYYNAQGPFGEMLRRLCPNGVGVNVPCSNREGLNWLEVFYRHANPDWMPGQ
jgi:hypothetical protein